MACSQRLSRTYEQLLVVQAQKLGKLQDISQLSFSKT